MRKLIMWNMVTLDGFFEGTKSWDLDWHNYAWGDELEKFSLDQLKSADMLLFGRITYDGMAAYWTTAQGDVADLMNSLPKVGFSRTLERVDWRNTTLVPGKCRAGRRRSEKTAWKRSLHLWQRNLVLQHDGGWPDR